MTLDPPMEITEALALEWRGDRNFVLCDEPPGWLLRLGFAEVRGEEVAIDQILPFLDTFLKAAEQVWAARGAARIDSGYWTEVAAGGEELHLVATALHLRDKRLLLITKNDAMVAERRQLLERARAIEQAHQNLLRELERKDVLVHCIVHDLAGPLNSVLGTLSLLAEQPHAEADLIRVALGAALRQRSLIREILDAFAAERSGLDAEDPDTDPILTPDLDVAMRQVIEELAPTAASSGVHIVGPAIDAGGRSRKIVGEERRLTRVLYNLLQNALRFSPRGGVVRVLVQDEPGAVQVAVEDDGPGVPPGVARHLFQKFALGRDPGAGTGLGLYFCRITVENWGGTIGYEPRPRGGARFWIRLRSAEPPTVGSTGKD